MDTNPLPEPIEENNPEQPAEPTQEEGLLNRRVPAMMIPLFLIIGVAIGYFIWGLNALDLNKQVKSLSQAATQSAVQSATQVAQVGENAAQAAAAAATVPADQQKPTRYDVPIDNDPVQGSENAAITLIEFSDYECPYCTKWQTEVLPQLLEAYGNKIRFVYKDFPLIGLHDNAAPAAEAADCAGEQGKYWEYHDLLFNGKLKLSTAAFKEYANRLNLDAPKFDDCLTSRRFQSEVEDDYNFATNLGIRSTPTFFINGLALVGAQPLEVFQQVIDQELAGKIPK
jgi:protein-disulfide isomerase